jgi:phosphatidate cytidylyltransferase
MLTRIITGLTLMGLLWLTLFHASMPVALGLVILMTALTAYELCSLFPVSVKAVLSCLLSMAGGIFLLIFSDDFLAINGLMVLFLAQHIFSYGIDSNRLASRRVLIQSLYSFCLVSAIFALVQLYLITPMLVLALISITACSDIGGYFIGKRWGKHKLCAMISPGKTWQGALGSVMMVILVTTCVIMAMDLNPASSLVIAIIVTVFAMLGDLLESWLKRINHKKDSGAILPGHGGVLDRIDSLILSAPLFFLMLPYY